MKTLLLLAAIALAGAADPVALEAKCNELLAEMQKTHAGEPARSDEEKAFAAEMAVLFERLIRSPDVELKYRFLRWQSLALINSSSQMIRAYEKRGKNVSDDFFREVKEQLAGAQRLVASIDALHD
jgi:hypothetical protein